MASLTVESFTAEIPYHRLYPVSRHNKAGTQWFRLRGLCLGGTLALQKPIYTHDRTIVTVVVLLCGTALLWNFGDSAQIVALVSSGWTLTLTFWFRFAPDPEGKQ